MPWGTVLAVTPRTSGDMPCERPMQSGDDGRDRGTRHVGSGNARSHGSTNDQGDRVTSTRPHRQGTEATAACRGPRRATSHARDDARRRRSDSSSSPMLLDGLDRSHPRTTCAVTYDGLRVVGGDLVVHRRRRTATFAGSSQTLKKSLTLSIDARPSLQARRSRSRQDRRAARATSAPELVVDATGAAPRLAWTRHHDRHAEGRHAEPPRHVRRRHDRQARSGPSSASRRSTVTAQSLYGGTVPLNADPVGQLLPAEGPLARQHLHDRHEQRDGLVPVSAVRLRVQDRDAVRQHRHPLRQRVQHRAASRRRSTRSTAPTPRGTTTRRPSAATGSSALAPARSTASTTARTTSTRSGTARR